MQGCGSFGGNALKEEMAKQGERWSRSLVQTQKSRANFTIESNIILLSLDFFLSSAAPLLPYSHTRLAALQKPKKGRPHMWTEMRAFKGLLTYQHVTIPSVISYAPNSCIDHAAHTLPLHPVPAAPRITPTHLTHTYTTKTF